MTEEDTIKALKKIPFEEMYNRRWSLYSNTHVFAIPEEFFTRFGWTWNEYILFDERHYSGYE